MSMGASSCCPKSHEVLRRITCTRIDNNSNRALKFVYFSLAYVAIFHFCLCLIVTREMASGLIQPRSGITALFHD
jgi:hypothetical protein